MAEISAVEERLSIDEKPSLDTYESYVRQDGDQTPEAWQEDWHRMYRNFLWTDAGKGQRSAFLDRLTIHVSRLAYGALPKCLAPSLDVPGTSTLGTTETSRI